MGETSWAGVFNTTRFVSPGSFSVGIEGGVNFASASGGRSGLESNLKYTHGLSDAFNASGIVGIGNGPRQFRVGGEFVFDMFPDIEGQPGIGVAGRTLYVTLPVDSQLEFFAIPYIHKSFLTGGVNEVDPFIAIPIGFGFKSEEWIGLLSFVVGSLFKSSEHLFFSVELGMALSNTNTYVSGGVTYFY